MPLPSPVSAGQPSSAANYQSLATNLQAEFTRRGPFYMQIIGTPVTALNGTYTVTSAVYSPSTNLSTITITVPTPIYASAISATVVFTSASGGLFSSVPVTIRSSGFTFIITGNLQTNAIIGAVYAMSALPTVTTGHAINASDFNAFQAAILQMNTFNLSNVALTTLAAMHMSTGNPVSHNDFNALLSALTFVVGQPLTYTLNVTLSANTPGYNMRSAAITAGWDGLTPLHMNLTINGGVYVFGGGTFGAAGTGNLPYALDTGGPFPLASVLTLANSGTITGYGGNGGHSQFNWDYTAPTSGSSALHVQYPITITNNGVIAGGGGGGQAALISFYGTIGASGGGGGAGEPPGTGGPAYANVYAAGAPGTATTGGAGGYSGITLGGAGGSLGAGGGGSMTVYGPPAFPAPGIAGNAVVGNGYITWALTGTRLGPII